MRWRRKAFLFVLTLVASMAAIVLSNTLLDPSVMATATLLAPAPTQPSGYYDYFGKSLSPQQAAKLVLKQGLNPSDPAAYLQIGAVQINQEFKNIGEEIFFNRTIGDQFGLQGVFGFGYGLESVLPEITTAIEDLHGQQTTNLLLKLQKNVTLGSHNFPQGSIVPTGLDVPAGGRLPIGLNSTLNITCALCHATLSNTGEVLKGVPNSDIGTAILIALAPNSAAGFARLHFDPLDPKYHINHTGKFIFDSKGQKVQLPDPDLFEQAFDDAVLNVPYGNFESSPDSINNTTQIPSVFTFKSGPYLFDGQFAVGPFGGLTAINNAVHSSEINLLAASQLSEQTIGVDREVYLGTVLQNAAEPKLRLPEDQIVKPSEWLRLVAPDPAQAELQDQIPAPGTGTYPNLKPSIFTYNGLVFSPNTGNPNDPASGPFLFADNAMAAFQNSLVPPTNQSVENQQALTNGSVQRGAKIFAIANCATCHIPPFFTDNKIHPIQEVKTNPARAESRLALNPLLVTPEIYTLDTPVPIPTNAKTLQVPTAGISKTPTTLPTGILPKGGYKTVPLRGLYLSAPYLHDGGVAVRAGAIEVTSDGIQIVDPTGLGLPGTLSQGIAADSASSLRALVDRQLRQAVIATNRAVPGLVSSNLDGTGHEFYVDREAGYSIREQTDLINFLLSLDNNPGQF